MNYSLVDGRIWALYNNDWFAGTIRWYNQTMEKSRVMLDEKNEDYISINDLNEVEINLIWFSLTSLLLQDSKFLHDMIIYHSK